MGIVYVDDESLDLENKRVFLRVDFNVPTREDGTIVDDSRIKAALETILFLFEKKAKIVIASHLGRPKGKFRKNLSMANVAHRLQQLLDKEIIFVDDCVGDGVKKIIADMKPSQIVLLENLRFHSGEEKNEDSFTRMLSQNIDVYVNDAFGTLHRAHASVSKLASMVPVKAGGFLLRKEIEGLTKLQRNPEKPFIAVLGGAKVSDKIGVILKLLPRLDALVIGGAMALTFLKAKGVQIGDSLVEEDKVSTARNILDKAAASNVRVLLPVDHVIMSGFEKGNKTQVTESRDIPEGFLGVDIGPNTEKLFAEAIKQARTLIFNGPMGVFEWESCFNGTNAVVQAMTKAHAFTFVGGGDSVSAVKMTGLSGQFSHLSTGGGASLEFLEGEPLPGLVALGY